jgi:tetratricopeptide (TPR) repeat protein
MPRWIPALPALFAATLCAQETAPPKDSKPAQPPAKQEELKRQRPKASNPKEEVPPEEDVALTAEEYTFNPLQAEKDVRVGNFYLRQGKLRSAEGRYRSATKWNDGYAEAWLRLGMIEEKLKDPKAARDAYSKYLEVASDAKNASEIRKKLDKLK